ncbi:glycosyltransferase family 76 protein [Xylariaceae sp. FL1019]|nr:glycosyltransferase family 76 protein [Xylariaceae sp. FL1019]
MSLTTYSKKPIQSLIYVFCLWKIFLLAIVIGSGVGPAYDTSSTLLSPERSGSSESFSDVASKLTRWDAIYFVQSSRRGYVYEQEWAFARGLPVLIASIAKAFTWLGVSNQDSLEPLIGISVANVSHLLSALVLYKLSQVMWENKQVSFVAAALHILSPAGLFLSAPYSESPFALFTFLGNLFLAKAVLSTEPTVAHDISLVASGLWFAIAVNFRSNGILSGLPFAVELCREMMSSITVKSIRRRLALMIGGSALAVGFAVPQFLAYQTFCDGSQGSDLRPWCTKRLPSIYTFVQEHYWNVGFLRYWTLPNIPLFLLAGPVLYLMTISGLDFISQPRQLGHPLKRALKTPNHVILVRSMASIQIVLTVLAITNYHIQIITRLSSAYPVMYWWLADLITRKDSVKFTQSVVTFMVMYASIQGALFASFLPPA